MCLVWPWRESSERYEWLVYAIATDFNQAIPSAPYHGFPNLFFSLDKDGIIQQRQRTASSS